MKGRIGPHEGRELELMLAGEKRLAFFQDYVPTDEFAPHVEAGTLVVMQLKEPDWPFPHTYYAIKESRELIFELHQSIISARETRGSDREFYERKIGLLLGYTDEDVDAFLANVR